MTGDHIETAKYVAIQSGLISEEEADEEGVVIDATQFREMLGAYIKIFDPIHKDYRVEFTEGRGKFDQVKKKVKVIARCNSEDKFIFVCGIKQKGGLVGMTGDSITDAEALQKADVGFCMGDGSDVAKDNSDLIILDNDFKSIHSAIKWGRAIFDNVKKFMQFQLTINIVICFITILGGATTGNPPLNVIQMLWTNLIMDILGAIAIGTEPYKKDAPGNQDLAQSNRISRKDSILKSHMWRQIVVQCSYQILIITIFMYFGNLIWFEESFNLVSEPMRTSDGSPTNKLVLNTFIFHTFILMNWFNTLNCRVLDDTWFFATIPNNPYLWLIMAAEMALQVLMVTAGNSVLGSALLGTAPLTTAMHITCWCLGAFSLVVNRVMLKMPLEKFRFTDRIDLETSNQNSVLDRVQENLKNKYDDAYKKYNESAPAEE
jgi:Ca2+-transporting ATPase